MATVLAPAALLFTASGSASPLVAGDTADRVADDAAPCCMEITAVAPGLVSPALSADQSATNLVSARQVSASRLRIVKQPRLLPVGVASEKGLQVRTILAERSISATFPEIHRIGGVRPDALRWHPNGLALDVMIPNPGTAAGIALGDEIVAFALENADRFALQDAIWRGTYYTPSGPQSGGYGHYDHVHITTTGGGYPTGDETYLARETTPRRGDV